MHANLTSRQKKKVERAKNYIKEKSEPSCGLSSDY